MPASNKCFKIFSGCEDVEPFGKCFSGQIRLRIFWISTIFILFACFSVHFYFQINRYLEYEKVTDTLIVDNGFEFPDVTICPSQPFDKSKYNEMKIKSIYGTFFKSWKSIMGQESNFKQNGEVWEATKHSLGMLLPSQSRELFRTLQSQLVYCQYNGYLCDHKNFTSYPVPGRKNCFSLRVNQRKLKQPGKNDGLYLIFNTNNSTTFLTPSEKLSHQVGYIVDLHPKGTRPQFGTAAFQAFTNEQTNVEVSMATINDISTPIDRCQTDKRTINVVYDFTSSSEKFNNFTQVLGDCRESELQLQLDIKCRCFDETLFISDLRKVSLCHSIPERFWKSMNFDVNQLTDKEKTNMKKKANCYSQERDVFRNYHLDVAQCYNPCDRVIYSKVITVNTLPDTATIKSALKEIEQDKDQMDASVPFIPEEDGNFVSMRIYPPTLNSMLYKKKLDFDWVELLSEAGGIVGLWVGWCILTLFEMIEAVMCCKRRESKTNNNEEEEMERFA